MVVLHTWPTRCPAVVWYVTAPYIPSTMEGTSTTLHVDTYHMRFWMAMLRGRYAHHACQMLPLYFIYPYVSSSTLPSRLLPPVLLLVHARREVGDVEDLPLLLLPTRVAGEVRVESANGCGWRGREMHEWLRRIGRNRCSWRKNGPVSLLPLTSSQSWGMSCQACLVGHSASPASRPAWPARPAGGTPVGVVSGQGQSTGDDVRTSAG